MLHRREGTPSSLRCPLKSSCIWIGFPVDLQPYCTFISLKQLGLEWFPPGALNDCFKAGAGRKTTSEANDRNRFEIPSLRGLDFARPVYFPFFQLAEPEMAVSIHVHNLESRSHC